MELSGSEMLMYGGIAAMVIVCILALILVIVFLLRWQKLSRRLEKEYGEPIR